MSQTGKWEVIGHQQQVLGFSPCQQRTPSRDSDIGLHIKGRRCIQCIELNGHVDDIINMVTLMWDKERQKSLEYEEEKG